MTNGRGIKSVGAAAIIVGFIVGAVVAARSITANRYLSIDLTHLAGLEIARQLTSWIGLALLLATVFLTVWLVARRLGRERSGLAIVTLLAISGSGLAAVDAALRRFTTLTVEFALSRAVARLGSASAPATFGEGARAVAMTYLLALAAVGTVLVFAVWTYRRLVRTDLTRLYYRRWISHKWLHRATAVAVLLTSLTHITTAIRGDRLSPTGPNIIFVVVDALRADAMGHLGYGRDTTPFLDSLATQSIVFRNTRSQSSWTKTSVASYMTSTFGMLDQVSTLADRLPPSVVTLAETLRNAGYDTGALIANPLITKEFGFDQGFGYFSEGFVEHSRIDTKHIASFLNRRRDDPYFLYIHYMDVHNPYEAPAPYYDMFVAQPGVDRFKNGLVTVLSDVDRDFTRALYDGELRYLDGKIQELVALLNARGELHKTVIVFTSDHGDEFYEHGGLGHGTTLYRELLHVPLMIIDHGILKASTLDIATPVRSIDIFPTVLAITRIEPVSTIHGRSLSPLWQGTPIAADSVVDLASVVSVASHDHLLTTASNGYRFIVNATQGHNELYDIEADPLEQYNLADSIPGVAADLEELLWKLVSEYVGTTGARSRTSIDRKTIERLKSLGYL